MSNFQAYLTLCKPKVVLLMLLSALVGMLLAAPTPNWIIILKGLTGIGLMASAGAALNHIFDRQYDRRMHRTKKRPLPQQTLSTTQAVLWAILLMTTGFSLLFHLRPEAAFWTLGTMLGYAWIYTCILKHQTPQNIVIGGLSGALPPLLGWVTITGQPSPTAWLLVLIIFAWTPPHFWALALAKKEEYAKTNIPMLPITHGTPYTLTLIWYYSILTVIATLLPYLTTAFGTIYLLGLIPLNGRWLYVAWQVKQESRPPMPLFVYSITYLMLLFILMLIDHYLSLPIAL